MVTVPHLYIAPHLDDAVLSCGGTIHRQVAHGRRVVVLTVFAGSPSVLVRSPLIDEIHARWNLGADPPAGRRREDVAALELLGAEAIHLAHPDCIYRLGLDGRPLYAQGSALFGDVSPLDPASPEELAGEVRRLWEALGRGPIGAPLAAGGHVDHQIVHRAARLLLNEGADVRFYEDYPYAENPDVLDEALRGRSWQSKQVRLSPQDLAAKVAAIACYGSQISSFWEDVKDMQRRVRAYTRAVGLGKPAERYWRLEQTGQPHRGNGTRSKT